MVSHIILNLLNAEIWGFSLNYHQTDFNDKMAVFSQSPLLSFFNAKISQQQKLQVILAATIKKPSFAAMKDSITFSQVFDRELTKAFKMDNFWEKTSYLLSILCL